MRFKKPPTTERPTFDPAGTGLTLRLFGQFDVTRSGMPLPRTRTRKEQWLLALLVLRHNEKLDRRELAAALWLDSEDSQALRNLRRSLSNLREVLGEDAFRILSPTPRSLSFDLSGAASDAYAFDHAIAESAVTEQSQRVSLLERAIELYRGPLLEGCMEDWVMQEREGRQKAYLDALETLAACAGAQQNPAKAVGHLRRIVAEDPFRESAQQALMQMLAESGDKVGASLVYRQFRLLLHEELRTEPSIETIALYQQLRHEYRSRTLRKREPVPTPYQVPRPLSDLVGREKEVREIKALLASARLLTLTGSGGIGKTRLAVAVAEQAATHFPDGVWFVDLASLSDPTLVPQAVASQLGVCEAPGRTLTEALEGALAAKVLLLILDNCEHLLHACAQIANALLSRCAGLHILATSRQALGITGEAAYRIPSLSLPPENPGPSAGGTKSIDSPLLTLNRSDAVRLFLERAMDASAAFALTDQNVGGVLQICRCLDGIPLALELAAARVKVLSVEQIAGRLDKTFNLLTGGSRTALPRHRTLRALMDWSYNLLSDHERRMLQRLSVFSGGWTLEAAEAITGENDEITDRSETPDRPRSACLTPDDVLELLSCLVDKSLVVAVEGAGGAVRYHLLETIRQYGQEKLRESGEWKIGYARHRDYYLHLAEEAGPRLMGLEMTAMLECLEREHGNLRAAMDWCRTNEGSAEQELRFVALLGRFWQTRGYLQEGRERLIHAIARHEGADATPCGGSAFHHLGWIAHLQKDQETAHASFEQALTIFRELNDRTRVADSLNRLGCVAKEMKDFHRAQELFDEALATFREIDDQRNAAYVLNNLGTLGEERYDPSAAAMFYKQGLEAARKIGQKDLLALLLDNLGGLTYRQGEYEAARRLMEESLRLRYEIGERPRLIATFCGFVAIAQAQGQMKRATHLHGAMTALCESIGLNPAEQEDEEYRSVLTKLRIAQSQEDFASDLAAGHMMTMEQAIEYALSEADS